MTDLPPNVYRLPQHRFDAIPGAPWVYWVNETIRGLFETMPVLGRVCQPRQGLATADNSRFLRFWWEVGIESIGFQCRDCSQARRSKKRWFPYMKGGGFRRWYGNLNSIVNWEDDGHEIQNFFSSTGRLASRPQNVSYYFLEGITYSYLTSAVFSARISPGGFIFDVAGSSLFPEDIPLILAIMNSSFAGYALKLINPTVNFQIGDLARLPIPAASDAAIGQYVALAVCLSKYSCTSDETTYDFSIPSPWMIASICAEDAGVRLLELQSDIDVEVFRIYGLGIYDQKAIEAELAGGGALESEDGEGDEDAEREDGEEATTEGAMTREELAVRWISYAVGVVLGRFRPGVDGALGCAVYRRDDFAIGSLPAPDEAEFDELVGPVERFAYVDAAGGRHVFPAEVEQALRDLALPDGIAVLDEGHPRDLPALVEKALRLMLDPPPSAIINRQSKIVNPADEVIALGTNGDLRKFLEKDFFTKWHLKWYRKRPVYWPLQSAKRGYGFVLFHEKVEKYTLYVLLRDYLDHKLNGLRLQIDDILALATGQTGAARRQTERQLDRARQLLDEVNVFAQAIDRIVKGGYQPEANWIDDGVILRLAPLWELIPIWKAEPKKYWERLEQGDYDWSHIAMAYWPARVHAVCRVNKSFAIAHGHEDWFDGG